MCLRSRATRRCMMRRNLCNLFLGSGGDEAIRSQLELAPVDLGEECRQRRRGCRHGASRTSRRWLSWGSDDWRRGRRSCAFCGRAIGTHGVGGGRDGELNDGRTSGASTLAADTFAYFGCHICRSCQNGRVRATLGTDTQRHMQHSMWHGYPDAWEQLLPHAPPTQPLVRARVAARTHTFLSKKLQCLDPETLPRVERTASQAPQYTPANARVPGGEALAIVNRIPVGDIAGLVLPAGNGRRDRMQARAQALTRSHGRPHNVQVVVTTLASADPRPRGVVG